MGNSQKNFRNQSKVARNVIEQIRKGNKFICGFLIESFLKEGAQILGSNPDLLVYGQSITDSCIGWEETEELLEFIAGNI